MNRVPSRKQYARSPKQPTHTDKKHTETFHRLPTIRQHPEKEETIKNKARRLHKLPKHPPNFTQEYTLGESLYKVKSIVATSK